ncbi:MAG: exonuclease SbcCD subunit D [Lachnospiraceae bacterium]|nr:exonuclease SbcCD subunit D [Lachnospiraceae bacterium]
MKLLHTSDWHLGMTLRGGMTYAEDQRFVLDQLCRIAQEEKADGILLAGDVFDKSIASQEAILLYDEYMTRLCKQARIPVYLIAGNHDGADRISQCRELLESSGLYIAGALTEEVSVYTLGDVDIFLLPWISTDKVRTLFPDRAEEIHTMEDACRVVLDRYRERFVNGRKKILVSHAFIVNAETSVSDRAAEVGKAAMVSAGVFAGFDYVALGHLHGPQDITEKIRYSGSPMAYSFGREEKQEKSVTLLDTDTMEKKVIPLPQLHRRTTLTGTFEELMEADFDEEIKSGYVRLEVTDSYVGMDTMAAFRERYDKLLEVTGKGLEKEDARITMTIEELVEADTTPEAVFSRYCRDVLKEEPDAHRAGLFEAALKEYEKEVEG